MLEGNKGKTIGFKALKLKPEKLQVKFDRSFNNACFRIHKINFILKWCLCKVRIEQISFCPSTTNDKK